MGSLHQLTAPLENEGANTPSTSVNAGQPPNLAGKGQGWLWQRQSQGSDAVLGLAGSRGQRVGAAPFALQVPHLPAPTLAWKDPAGLLPGSVSPSTAPVHWVPAAEGVNRPSCVGRDQRGQTAQNEPRCRGRALLGCGTKGRDRGDKEGGKHWRWSPPGQQILWDRGSQTLCPVETQV